VIVVSNSSPLIALDQIDQLHLLTDLFVSLRIPPAVAAEVAPTLPTLPSWVQVTSLGQPNPPEALRLSLGKGEREALSLAHELKADWLIVDDLPARQAARTLGLRVTGTLGVLLAAKRRGLIERLRPSLDRLLRESFFMSPALYDELLERAGERDPTPDE
jgi:predicted nucleic acid-binding protein